jgi:hypothetical protein
MPTLALNKPYYSFYFDAVDKRGQTLLPNNIGVRLDVNPDSLDIAWSERYTIDPSYSGFVRTEWPAIPNSLNISTSSAVFFTRQGLVTDTAQARKSIAYDNWMDLLSLYQSNACLYDSSGRIVYQGKIKVTWAGFTAYGTFDSFSVTRGADSPHRLSVELTMQLSKVQLRAGAFES